MTLAENVALPWPNTPTYLISEEIDDLVRLEALARWD